MRWYFLVIVFAFTFATNLTLDFYLIRGNSMRPAICNNDIVIAINPWVYSFFFKYRYGKGDIIVFKINSEKKNLIKRIIAVEGDTLSLVDDGLRVNKKIIKSLSSSNTNIILGDWHYRYLNDDIKLFQYLKSNKTEGPIIVKKDSYFVLGDNLNNSYDSRQFGFIPSDQIIAKVSFFLRFSLFLNKHDNCRL